MGVHQHHQAPFLKIKIHKEQFGHSNEGLTIEVDCEVGVVASGCAELSSLYLNVTSRLKQRAWSRDESVGSKVVREPQALQE